MALEPAQDGVGVAVRSTEGEADEIELLGGNRPHGGAVVGVVAGGEHLVGVKRHRDIAIGRPAADRR